LAAVFQTWANAFVPITPGEWLTVDGKSLRGTVTAVHTSEQRLISLVSVFAQQRGQVIAMQRVEQGKASEIPVVQDLLEVLDVQGVVSTLDALHCQKKPRPC